MPRWTPFAPPGTPTNAPSFVHILVYVYRILVDVAERKDPLDECIGFDWDEANAQKNWVRHQVTPSEAEDAIFNEPLVVAR